MGSIVSSLAGPAFVDDPVMLIPDRMNSTTWNQSHSYLDITWTLRAQIGHFMTFHFLMAVVVFALIVAYFPSKPEIPPENAKSTPRLKPMEGLRVALRYIPCFLCSSFIHDHSELIMSLIPKQLDVLVSVANIRHLKA